MPYTLSSGEYSYQKTYFEEQAKLHQYSTKVPMHLWAAAQALRGLPGRHRALAAATASLWSIDARQIPVKTNPDQWQSYLYWLCLRDLVAYGFR